MDENDICKIILKVKGHHLVDDKEIEIGKLILKEAQKEAYQKGWDDAMYTDAEGKQQ